MGEELKEKQKKLLLGYQDCAREIKAVSPKVAYYSRLYGVDQALALGTKDLNPVIKEFITAELVDLEASKAALGVTPSGRDGDAVACRDFAKVVFVRADKLDRAGPGGNAAATGLAFKRAVQFFSVASQFGPLPDELAQLKKYAAWRSVELLKAHKEGRAPEAPPPLDALAADAEAELMDALNSLPAVPSASGAAPAAAPRPPAPAAPRPPPPTQQPPSGGGPPPPPLRAFAPGQRVLYCPDGTVNCIKEDATVQRVAAGPDGQPLYTVALTRRRGAEITVPGELLAPAVDAGERVVLFSDDGGASEEVEVEEVYASRWPPTFLVKVPGRGLVEVEDERLARPAPPPAVPAPAPAPLPSEADARAELAAQAAVAAAAAEHEELSTIGEEPTLDGDSVEGESEGEGAKSEASSVAAAALVAEAVSAAQAEAAAAASAASAAAAAQPAVPIVVPPSPLSDGPSPPAPPPAVSTPQPPPPPAPAPSAPVYPAPTAPPAAPQPPPAPPIAPPPPQASYPPAPAAGPGPSSHAVPIDPNYEPPLAAVMEAQKVTKTAGSALTFEDVPTAVKYLQEALDLLTRPGAAPQKK